MSWPYLLQCVCLISRDAWARSGGLIKLENVEPHPQAGFGIGAGRAFPNFGGLLSLLLLFSRPQSIISHLLSEYNISITERDKVSIRGEQNKIGQ